MSCTADVEGRQAFHRLKLMWQLESHLIRTSNKRGAKCISTTGVGVTCAAHGASDQDKMRLYARPLVQDAGNGTVAVGHCNGLTVAKLLATPA